MLRPPQTWGRHGPPAEAWDGPVQFAGMTSGLAAFVEERKKSETSWSPGDGGLPSRWVTWPCFSADCSPWGAIGANVAAWRQPGVQRILTPVHTRGQII